MGYRCRWIAVEAHRREEVSKRLGLRGGARVTAPICDPGLFGVELPTGWYLIFADGWDFMERIGLADATDLSEGGRAIFFYCDDGPMETSLFCLLAGKVEWSIEHASDTGTRLQGELPQKAREALASAGEKQAAQAKDDPYPADYLYGVTAAFALSLLGFRHDETLDADDFPPTRALIDLRAGAAGGSKPWWRFW